MDDLNLLGQVECDGNLLTFFSVECAKNPQEISLTLKQQAITWRDFKRKNTKSSQFFCDIETADLIINRLNEEFPDYFTEVETTIEELIKANLKKKIVIWVTASKKGIIFQILRQFLNCPKTKRAM